MSIEQDKHLDAAVAKLPRSIQPKQDLWPSIHAQITRRDSRSLQPHWKYGFAAAAVLLVGVATTWISLRLHTTAPENNFAEIVPHVTSTQTGPGDLSVQFAAQLASDKDLPPAARVALVNNLRLIHNAILRTQVAVKKYPGDINLQSLLLDLYQQEARLMAEAQQAQIQTTVRTTL
jgi:hypothetical protein